MCADFLQAFKILTEFAVHAVRQYLGVFAVDYVTLAVEEPCRDLVLCRVLNDGDDSFEFFRCNITGTRKRDESVSQAFRTQRAVR